MTIREQRAARCKRLHDKGLLLREIAAQTGYAKSTVHALLTDPDGAALKARKDSYRGTCECCGGLTDGSSGQAKAPKLCQECREWPEEAIVAAMQDWAEAHGGAPPTSTEWRSSGPGHPCASSPVIRRLGWNNLLLKAGLTLWCDRRPETQAEIERLLREGLSTQEVAERTGISPPSIAYRLRYRGTSISEFRRTA